MGHALHHYEEQSTVKKSVETKNVQNCVTINMTIKQCNDDVLYMRVYPSPGLCAFSRNTYRKGCLYT